MTRHEYVKFGIVLGLGTSSTTAFVIAKLGHILSTGQLSNIIEATIRSVLHHREAPAQVRNHKSSAAEEKLEVTAPVAEKEEAPVGFTPLELDPNMPSPIFGGSTGGLLRKAQVEEFYAITWNFSKEQIFEMPTGSAAIMRQGPNLLKLARKE
ncbi:photosystem I reaction center subunit II-2, chloroplastic-like [Arachis stenosperma]|uniref:photosystem I reaction center subunit II-2, chloroplastic-like n=1 Tax=Arachis stenosperma TaxID=217475 RepID=UPI0025AD3B51|nr:photosystem I reaction center subunit II-2, chloroplastic-like [Arachis stenosperma]